MLYVRFPLSLRKVEDLLHERGIEVSHETVRFWWMRFGPMFAAEIRKCILGRGTTDCFSLGSFVRGAAISRLADLRLTLGRDPVILGGAQ
jgi:hypothetical protein